MTLGISRSATAPELALYRAPGKKSKFYCAIFQPATIYTARINQSFSSLDGVVSLVFDGGVGTLANVKADMLAYIGTTAGARDVGLVRIRSTDATHFYINLTSGIEFADNQYITVVDDYRLLQRHVNVVSDVIYMDGAVAYSDQHTLPDPTPIMGSHRILKMTGASVATTFAFGQSYMIDGTAINTKVTTCLTGVVTNSTTYTPTVTFSTCGWHAVYLTLTGANGKSFFGVRYVYVWNDANLPPRVKIGNISGDINSGGWSFEVDMYRNATLDDVVEGTLCALFSVDYYGDTQQSIGAVDGSENVEAVGWISSPESVSWNPVRMSSHFYVQGPQYWLKKISSYPSGVVFTPATPTSWSEFKDLTVDKGVWHFLHWRCTATRIMDCFLSGDTKFASEITSLATDLWSQLQEMTALTIFARPLFNSCGQLFIQTHPQLVPEASRTWATVMDITTHDWLEDVPLERITMPEVTQVFLSGVQINNGGEGAAYHALAPGHTYNHYGTVETIGDNKLLTSNQASISALAGMYFKWRNNSLPDIPITLSANVRLIDIAPNQFCNLTILPADTARGISYSGKIISKAITVTFNDFGRTTRNVTFEAETFEGVAVQEIIPGSGDLTYMPDFPTFPSLPVAEYVLPGTGLPILEDLGPPRVLGHDKIAAGLVFTSKFNTASPIWYQVNGGLTSTQYLKMNRVVICPNGAVYVAYLGISADVFVARAPVIGGTFEIVIDASDIAVDYPIGNPAVYALNCNRSLPEAVAFVAGGRSYELADAWYGVDGDFEKQVHLTNVLGGGSISFGLGVWLLTYQAWSSGPVTYYRKLSEDCSSIISTTFFGHYRWLKHIRNGVTGFTYHYYDEATQKIKVGTDNLTSSVNVGTSIQTTENLDDGIAFDPTGTLMMTDYSATRKGKSSDGGASWADLSGLAYVGGIWRFAYAGGVGTASRWVAASSYMQLSLDFGVTWETRQGNLNALSPLYQIDVLKVIGYGS